MAGSPSRKENRAASTRLKPRKSAAVNVEPERDTTGISAPTCAIPTTRQLGHRQQGNRAQRLLGVHNVGSERQGPLSPRCVPPAARVPGAQARRAGAAEPVRCERGADRGQGLGHPADPGADRRRLHGVTRYQPTTDKIMRLNSQTGVIENGFVHIPETAPWLAEYLHEMTVFPKGKHDDQVDST